MSEKRTGIERLRNLYREWVDGDRVPFLEDRISEIADQIEREFAALEPRLMPEGMEWPPKDCEGEDLHIGEKAHFLRTEYDGDHEWDDVIVAFRHQGVEGEGDSWIVEGEKGEAFACDCAVERPAVIAADGLPLEVGDTVWFVDCESCDEFVSENLSFRDEMRVVEINRGSVRPVVVQHAHGSAVGFCKPNSITHARPDTQARIDSDAWKDATAYCQEYGVPVGYPKHAGKMKCEHLLRRQRELDKREMWGERMRMPDETRREWRERMRRAKWSDLKERQRELCAKGGE